MSPSTITYLADYRTLKLSKIELLIRRVEGVSIVIKVILDAVYCLCNKGHITQCTVCNKGHITQVHCVQ